MSIALIYILFAKCKHIYPFDRHYLHYGMQLKYCPCVQQNDRKKRERFADIKETTTSISESVEILKMAQATGRMQSEIIIHF